MPEIEEEFDHTPEKVLTAGDLKRALADVPDDTRLVFNTAEEPGSNIAGATQIAYSAAMGQTLDPQARRTVPAFEVELEFAPGRYLRRVWKDDAGGDE